MIEKDDFALRYDQVSHGNARAFLYHFALAASFRVFAASGLLSRWLSRNRVQFLCLHHVFEDEELPFRNLLDALSREHRLISYSEAVARIWNGSIDAPYVAISFDDGLKNCLRAARIMSEFGVKACFFVCPSVVGETDHDKIAWFCDQRLEMPPVEFLSWEDLEALLKEGHEIGAHTVTHQNLAQVSPETAREEVGKSLALLTNRIGPVMHFAWPYGRFAHLNPVAAGSVFEAGFRSSASIERGCHVRGIDGGESSLCIRRDWVVAKWPASQTLALLAWDSQRAMEANNLWPEGWL